jgi:hypothetical protein
MKLHCMMIALGLNHTYTLHFIFIVLKYESDSRDVNYIDAPLL